MGEERDFYSENLAMVFWNMDDYPIPAACIEDDLGFIRPNIVEFGRRMGFNGVMEIDVYCKRIKDEIKQKLCDEARIFYLPACTKHYIEAADKKVAPPPPLDMTCFMVRSALTVFGPYGIPDIVVIAKPLGELNRVLKCLQSRGHKILLIDPTAITGSFFSVESLFPCARCLFTPPPPTRIALLRTLLPDHFSLGEYLAAEEHLKSLSSDVDVEEDTSKIVDFFEPIRPVEEDRTGVFWDGEDFLLPLSSSSPDEIYAKIESALVERDYIHKLSIWVYLDDNKKGTWRDALLSGGKKEWASRIYFLPGGDKASRRIRMANDITFWARDSSTHRFEANVILFSDQFRDDVEYTQMLRNLLGSCDILSVTLTQGINIPESDPEWPRLLMDEGAYRLRY